MEEPRGRIPGGGGVGGGNTSEGKPLASFWLADVRFRRLKNDFWRASAWRGRSAVGSEMISVESEEYFLAARG